MLLAPHFLVVLVVIDFLPQFILIVILLHDAMETVSALLHIDGISRCAIKRNFRLTSSFIVLEANQGAVHLRRNNGIAVLALEGHFRNLALVIILEENLHDVVPERPHIYGYRHVIGRQRLDRCHAKFPQRELVRSCIAILLQTQRLLILAVEGNCNGTVIFSLIGILRDGARAEHMEIVLCRKTALLDLQRIVRAEMARLDTTLLVIKLVRRLGNPRTVNHQALVFAIVRHLGRAWIFLILCVFEAQFIELFGRRHTIPVHISETELRKLPLVIVCEKQLRIAASIIRLLAVLIVEIRNLRLLICHLVADCIHSVEPPLRSTVGILEIVLDEIILIFHRKGSKLH